MATLVTRGPALLLAVPSGRTLSLPTGARLSPGPLRTTGMSFEVGGCARGSITNRW